ncbi:MAG TPA: alpha-hydroxy acid oxidase, partial [Rhabdaerophilum sp.]|nr:alpha-hydroxy acid oxidase [Rhabdaerophilum sp.]
MDFEALAARGLEARRAAYLFGGAADGLTLSANRKALDEIRLLPRVLADLSQASARVSLFGDVYRAPVFVAPMGYQKLFHETGESGLAQAAAAMGAGFVLSTQASCPIETVAEAGEGAPQWFQLYFQPERDATLRLVRRAEAAGYRAIVVTVDAPVSGVRNHEMRAGFRLPPDVAAVNLA